MVGNDLRLFQYRPGPSAMVTEWLPLITPEKTELLSAGPLRIVGGDGHVGAERDRAGEIGEASQREIVVDRHGVGKGAARVHGANGPAVDRQCAAAQRAIGAKT